MESGRAINRLHLVAGLDRLDRRTGRGNDSRSRSAGQRRLSADRESPGYLRPGQNMTHSPETVDSDTFVLSIHGLRIAARTTGSGDPVLAAQRLVPPDGELDVFRRRASRDNWHRIGWSRGLRERNSG